MTCITTNVNILLTYLKYSVDVTNFAKKDNKN